MNKKIIYIQGMHCVACEKLLDEEFRTVPGVSGVKVDRKANLAQIFYEKQEPEFTELEAVAKKYGYEAFESDPVQKPEKSFVWTEWIEAGLIVLGLWVAFRIFQNLGYLDRIDLKGAEMSYGVSFLVGLVASISSCLAVVGAVVIAFGEKYRSGGGSFFESAVKPNLFFHVGRVTTFFLLGGMLGMIGGELELSGNFVGIFTILVALVMGWLGLNILGVLPSISNLGLRMPGGLTSKWGRLKASEHTAAPFLLGGLSFFLPCGFTQSMQLFALASGSFWAGALALLFFALGTVPSLLILGVTASWTKSRKIGTFQKVAGILVLVFALYTLQSGLALKGVKADVISSERVQDMNGKPDGANAGEEQVVEMHVTSRGFEPSTFRIKKGVPVKWVIKGDRVTSCTNKIIVPSLNISKALVSGDNVVRFTAPDQPGTVPFSCWMGMVRGKFIVE